MVALFDDIAVAHDQNEVGAANGRQTVGDDEAGTAFHEGIHGLLDLDLSTGIDAGGGLIENEDLGVGQDGTGNGQQLLLTLRDVGAFLVEDGVITLGQSADEVVGTGSTGSGINRFVGCLRAAITDIFTDGTAEQPGILQNHAKDRTQIAALEVADVITIDLDGTALYIIEAHEQLDDGGLACTCGTDDGDGTAGFGGGTQVMDDDLVGIIAKSDIFKGDTTFDGGRIDRGIFTVGLFCFVQQAKDTLGSRHGRLQLVTDAGDLVDGLAEALGIGQHGLDVTNGDLAAGSQPCTQNGNDNIGQVAHEIHDGADEAAKELALTGNLIEFLVFFGESCDGIILVVEGLEDGMAAVAFFNDAINAGQNALARLEKWLGALHDLHNHNAREGNNAQDGSGHGNADTEHHVKDTDNGGNRADDLGDALGNTLGDGIDIIGDIAENFAVGTGIEIAHGQAMQLGIDVAAQVETDLLGDAVHNIALTKGEDGADTIEQDERLNDDPQGIKIDAACAGCLTHDTCIDLGGGIAQDLGALDGKDGTADGKEGNDQQLYLIGGDVTNQTAQRLFEIFGLFNNAAGAAGASAHTGTPAHTGSAGSAGRRTGTSILIFSHWQVPPSKAGSRRSLCIPRRFPSAAHGYPCRRCGLRRGR